MKLYPILLLSLVSLCALAQEPADSRLREIAIIHVNVVPMDREVVLQDQTVVIQNGAIKSMGKGSRYSRKALVIDGTGKYLIPGIAEMHAHVPPIEDIAPMKDVLFLFAAHGITTIRGMLGHPKHLELRTMVRQGEVLGPHFYTTGPSFNGLAVRNPETAADMVRKQKAAGYDFLKLHPGLTKDNFAAIAKTADEVGIPFVGHVSFGVGIWRAIDAKYSSIDHLDGFIEGMVPGIEGMSEQQAGLFGMFVAAQADTAQIPKLMSGLKSQNIWVVPTQSLAERWFSPDYSGEQFKGEADVKYLSPETVDGWLESKSNLVSNPAYDPSRIRDYILLRRRLIKHCQRAGVGLLLGCDAPQVFNVPGSSTHNELYYLVKAGLTPYEALRTGTANVANYLKLPDSGVIKAGAVADIVLISGNPLQDITQTKRIEGVAIGGKWLSREYLDAGLKELEKQ